MIMVLYFSITGNSERIAEEIAKKTASPLARITDNKSWKGLFGFIKGGFYASRLKLTEPIVNPEVSWDEYEKIVIVSPVWVNNVAPAVYSLLLKNNQIMEKLVLVINNIASDTDNAFKNIESKLGTIPQKFGITNKQKNENHVISKIIEILK